MRRRHQTAKLFERGKDPKWAYQWRQDRLPPKTGRSRRTRTLDFVRLMSRRQAQALADAHMTQINSIPTPFAAKQGKTVAEAVQEWREPYAVRHKDSTVRAAESHIAQHILPKLGTLHLKEITKRTMQVFVTDIAKTGIHGKTISNILGTLSGILDTAREVDDSVPDVKRFGLAIPYTKPSREPHSSSPEETRVTMNHARQPYDTIAAVLGMTGCRIGEVLGLKTDDLDFDRKTIHIRRSIDSRTRKEQSTKTESSANDVPLPPELERRLLVFLKNGHRENPNQHLFVNRNLRPYSVGKVVEYGLWPVQDKFGLKRTGTHSFRHGLASGMLEEGATLPQVQRQMRHKDPRTTLRYVHEVADSHREIVNSYSRKFEDAGQQESRAPKWSQKVRK